MNDKLSWLMRINELQTKAAALLAKAELVKAGGDWAKADSVFRERNSTMRDLLAAALEHNAEFPDTPYEIEPIANDLKNTLFMGADVTQTVGKREDAEAFRKEAQEIAANHLGRAGQADAERSRAAAFTLEGRFNEAIMALMNARDDIVARGENLELTRVTIDLADLFQWLGDFRRAKDEIFRAEQLIEPLVKDGAPSTRDVLSGLASDISSIFSGKGDPGTAMDAMQLYRASLEISYYHGLIAKALGEWAEAERFFERVRPEYQKMGSGPAIEFQQAMVKVGKGLHTEALVQFRDLEPTFEQGPYRPKKPALMRAEAECLHALGRTDEARELLDKSVEELKELHFDPDLLWRSQWLQAKVSADEGDDRRALEALGACVDTIDDLRRAPLGYRLDSTFLSDKTEVFGDAVRRSFQAGDFESCCAFMDSLKSRTLSAVLSIPETGESALPAKEAEFEQITRQLDALDFRGYRDGQTAALRKERKELLQARAVLLEQIRVADPRWRSITESPSLDFEALFETLGDRNQAALSLFLDGDELFAVLIADGETFAESLTLPNKIRKKLDDYAKNLRSKLPDVFEHDLSKAFKLEAGQFIPSKLIDKAAEHASMVVIPHGILHLVPWSGLIQEGQRLFELLPVGILPNLSSMLNRKPLGDPAKVALVGVSDYGDATGLDPLPSAPDELNAVANAYGKRRVAARLLDAEATEQAFWSAVEKVKGDGNVLHMSCHGRIVPDEPMNSGLVVYDAMIDAAEVARAKLPFDEVVLSACSTGWRPIEVEDVSLTSDEVLSIPGGFLEAGASSVLLSIPVAEGKSASELVTAYHQRRIAGETPLRAFRSAQMRMLEHSGAKPALWIGFTLYGCQ